MEQDKSAININDLTPEARERYFRNEIATAENRTEMERKVNDALFWVTSELGSRRLSRQQAVRLLIQIFDQWTGSNSLLFDQGGEAAATNEQLIGTLRQLIATAFETDLYFGQS